MSREPGRGEVYLAGELERGIVPDESAWLQGGGDGEDGCLLLLRKMNLELLRQCARAPCCASACTDGRVRLLCSWSLMVLVAALFGAPIPQLEMWTAICRIGAAWLHRVAMPQHAQWLQRSSASLASA